MKSMLVRPHLAENQQNWPREITGDTMRLIESNENGDIEERESSLSTISKRELRPIEARNLTRIRHDISKGNRQRLGLNRTDSRKRQSVSIFLARVPLDIRVMDE